MDNCIEEKSVSTTIPNDMDECHQLVSEKRARPGNVVSAQTFSPRRNGLFAPAKGKCMEVCDRLVLNGEVRPYLGSLVHWSNVLIPPLRPGGAAEQLAVPGNALTAAHPNSNWVFRGYSPGSHIHARQPVTQAYAVFDTRAV
jgi:hypothetical protein